MLASSVVRGSFVLLCGTVITPAEGVAAILGTGLAGISARRMPITSPVARPGRMPSRFNQAVVFRYLLADPSIHVVYRGLHCAISRKLVVALVVGLATGFLRLLFIFRSSIASILHPLLHHTFSLGRHSAGALFVRCPVNGPLSICWRDDTLGQRHRRAGFS